MARAFLESGLYSWNSGMFIWNVKAILQEFERQMPQFFAQLRQIENAINTPQEENVLETVWADVQKETIDYGIMEHAHDVAVLPVCIGWNDVRSWDTLTELLEADQEGNVVIGDHIALDTHDTLIYSPHKLVATIGMQDLIIVQTKDALLICPRERSQDVRKIVDTLRQKGRQDLL